MRHGVVDQFDQDKSYGFIKDDLTHAKYFVFRTAIQSEEQKRLHVGQRVHFQLAQGKRGLQCVNVYLD